MCSWFPVAMGLPDVAAAARASLLYGRALLKLSESDIRDLLGVVDPLARVYEALQSLLDASLALYGVSSARVTEYAALLDVERVAVIARLKVSFDHMDGDGDGKLSKSDVERVFPRPGPSRSGSGVVDSRA